MSDADKHLCPVCGKHEFEMYNSYFYCPVCGWCDDAYQEEYPDEDCLGNYVSLNQAREAYKRGEHFNHYFDLDDDDEE